MAVVVFVEGKVIQAATNDLRDSLGSLLFVKGLADESSLRRALEIQRGPRRGMKLGQVLVEMGVLTREQLEETIRKHIENLVCMLLKWEKGDFSFETEPSALDEELRSATRELEIDDGLSTEYLLVESARLLDESNRNGPDPAAGPGETSRPAPPASPESASGDRRRPVVVVTEYRPWETASPPPVPIRVARQPGSRTLPGKPSVDPSDPPRREPSPGAGAAQRRHEMEALRAVSGEMRTQSSFTGVALLTLRYAKNLFGRAAVFRVTGGEMTEIGQFGMEVDGSSPDAGARKVKMPPTAKSVLADVIRDGTSKRGRTKPGGTGPDEYVMVPAICEGKVTALLYGDNAPDGAPLPAILGLEVLMQEAGLMLEKASLRKRLRDLQ